MLMRSVPNQTQPLVLLTSSFPLGPGEPFVAHELPYLCHYFEPIHLVPTDLRLAAWQWTKDVGSISRALPPGVKIHMPAAQELAIMREASVGQRTLQMLSAGPAAWLWSSWNGRHPSLQTMRAAAAHMSHAARICSVLKRHFGPPSGSASSGPPLPSPLFYAYWLGPASLALSLMLQQGQGRWRSRSQQTAETRPFNPQPTAPPITVCRAHGTDLYGEVPSQQAPGMLPQGAIPTFQNLAGSTKARVFATSTHGAALLRKRHALWPAEITVVGRLGVPAANRLPKIPCPASPQPGEVDTNAVHILSCSRLVPLKRVKVIAQALRHLASVADCQPIIWTHIGAPPDHAPATTQEQFHMPSKIRFRPLGALPHAAVIQHLERHFYDLFVNVSAHEGVPVAMMEALAHGTPVLGPAVGGIPELLPPDWPTGPSLLSTYPDPVTVARAIQTHLRAIQQAPNGPQARQANRQAALSIWQQRCNAQPLFEQHAQQLHALASHQVLA